MPIEVKQLEEMGYTVEQKSPWHFRIRLEENDAFIDFWPTTQKYCLNKNGSFSSSAYYTDIRLIAEEHLPC